MQIHLSQQLHTAAVQFGGGTIDRNGQSPSKGWAVGGAVPTLEEQAVNIDSKWFDQAEAFIAAASTDYFGSWLDDGVLYLDAVDIIEDTEAALELARARNEMAIYNIGTQETLWVEEEG